MYTPHYHLMKVLNAKSIKEMSVADILALNKKEPVVLAHTNDAERLVSGNISRRLDIVLEKWLTERRPAKSAMATAMPYYEYDPEVVVKFKDLAAKGVLILNTRENKIVSINQDGQINRDRWSVESLYVLWHVVRVLACARHAQFVDYKSMLAVYQAAAHSEGVSHVPGAWKSPLHAVIRKTDQGTLLWGTDNTVYSYEVEENRLHFDSPIGFDEEAQMKRLFGNVFDDLERD